MAAGKGTFADPAAPYPAPDPSSAYAKARQEWNNREGTLVKRLANWQRCCGGLTLALVLALLSITALAGRAPKVLVHVVEVAEPGQVRSAGTVEPWKGQQSGPIRWAMLQWLENMRTIGTDPILFERQWSHARDFMTQKAVNVGLPGMKERWDMHTKGVTVQIAVTSLLPITPDYRALILEWTERTFSQQGVLTETMEWKGTVNLAIYPVTEAKEPKELRNILGIFVTHFNFERKRVKEKP